MSNYSHSQTQTYNALKIAAERIGANNYRSGLYKPGKKGYSITFEHRRVIDAMSAVLKGTLSADDAMGIIHEYDVFKQIHPK